MQTEWATGRCKQDPNADHSGRWKPKNNFVETFIGRKSTEGVLKGEK